MATQYPMFAGTGFPRNIFRKIPALAKIEKTPITSGKSLPR